MSTNAPASQVGGDGRTRPSPSPLHSWVVPLRLRVPLNPALLKHAEARGEYAQNRIADRITTFAGSMAFVYIHILWFGCWIGFGVESYPYGLLTMIVSLEAIFLSTFVMISQNRAEAKRQVIADEQWKTVQEEDRQNRELLTLSQEQDRQNKQLIEISTQTLQLTKQVRALADKAGEESVQTKELLTLSKRNLALTERLHAGAQAGR